MAGASSSSTVSHLAADVNRDADDHGGHGDACDEGDADRRSDQGAQLPQNLLLPAPRLLPPEGTAGWTDGDGGRHRGMELVSSYTSLKGRARSRRKGRNNNCQYLR